MLKLTDIEALAFKSKSISIDNKRKKADIENMFVSRLYNGLYP